MLKALFVTHCMSRFHLDLPTPHPEHVEEFQTLYERYYGQRLSVEQATNQLIHLLAIAAYQRRNARHRGSGEAGKVRFAIPR